MKISSLLPSKAFKAQTKNLNQKTKKVFLPKKIQKLEKNLWTVNVLALLIGLWSNQKIK